MASNQLAVTNNFGVMLTIGMLLNGERVACVEPYGLPDTAADPTLISADLVQSWEALCQTAFQGCLSADCQLTFLNAEPMIDGSIPYRDDFATGTNPGALAAGALPANNCGLIVYYEDPADIPAGKSRISVGKTFMPAIPDSLCIAQNLQPTITAAYAVYAALVQEGFTSTLYSGFKWQRMLTSPKPRTPGTAIRRTIKYEVRGAIYTQRRRLLPR